MERTSAIIAASLLITMALAGLLVDARPTGVTESLSEHPVAPAQTSYGPARLDDEHVFLSIMNPHDRAAELRVTLSDVKVADTDRAGIVATLFLPDGTTQEGWYVVGFGPLGRVEFDAVSVGAPNPLAPILLPIWWHDTTFTIEVPPGQSHLLVGPLWHSADVEVAFDDPEEGSLSLIARDQEMFRFRQSSHDGDFSDVVLEAWVTSTGVKVLGTTETLRHERNLVFSAAVADYSDSTATRDDGADCQDTIGMITLKDAPGAWRFDHVLAKAPYGAYGPHVLMYIYDVPLPPVGPPMCGFDPL